MSQQTLISVTPAATAGTNAALAAGARRLQLVIRARLMTDVTKLWPVLDKHRLNETFPGWLQTMKLLIGTYHGESSQAAAATYQAARQHALEDAAPVHIPFAPMPDPQWLDRALGYAGPGQLRNDTARPGTALATTLGTATRIALDGGRVTVVDAVHHDPDAVGWYRVTSSSPCAFCAMLASRGIAYKNEHSAAFKVHNDCGCIPMPAYSRDHELPQLNGEALAVYRSATRGARSGTQLQAFRKAWDARTQPVE